MSETFDADSRQKSQQLLHFKSRPPMPPGSRTTARLLDNGLNTVAIVVTGVGELGSLEYGIETAQTLHYPWLAQTAPYLYSTGPGGHAALPKLLVIYGFHSHYEHAYKGIGSAMLREVVRLAETNECPWILVVGGINLDVYQAFGFEQIDTNLTWCTSTTKLRSRLAGRPNKWAEV